MYSKLLLHALLWAFASTAFAADWRDYSVGKIGTLQYDVDSYRRDPGSSRASIATRDVLPHPGRLEDGREYAYVETRTVANCDRQELGAAEVRYVGANQEVLRKIEPTDPQQLNFMKASAGNLKRFVISVCNLELRGLGGASLERRWIHYLENESGALYFDSAGIRAIKPYQRVHVRLYYLGGAQLPNGQKVDLSEADWIIDCRNKRGAIATEAKIRVRDGQREVVDWIKADAKEMRFAVPTPGTLPALFTESLCGGELTR